jgi:LPXTG-site transpeptidase (sortase) family protein
MTTARQCPYLGLVDNRKEARAEPSRDHRCYASFEPQHVGIAYQSGVCLKPGFQDCPRFSESRQETGAWGGLVPLPASSPSHSPARQPVTLVELVALGLALCIVFAFLFVGYALYYRLSRVGAGIPVAAVTPAPTTALPLSSATPLPETASPAQPATSVAEVAPPEGTMPTPEAIAPTSTPTPEARPPSNAPPSRLVIPKIDLDIPVVTVGVKTIKVGGKLQTMWADAPNAGGFHQTSAYPGHEGNTVINGHRDIQGSVFRRLNKVEVGDEIILYVGEIAYPYRVTETVIVPETFASARQRAENLKYIGYIPEERLTLVTCTPIGLATHRLLVIAKPPGQIAPLMPGSEASP